MRPDTDPTRLRVRPADSSVRRWEPPADLALRTSAAVAAVTPRRPRPAPARPAAEPLAPGVSARSAVVLCVGICLIAIIAALYTLAILNSHPTC